MHPVVAGLISRMSIHQCLRFSGETQDLPRQQVGGPIQDQIQEKGILQKS